MIRTALVADVPFRGVNNGRATAIVCSQWLPPLSFFLLTSVESYICYCGYSDFCHQYNCFFINETLLKMALNIHYTNPILFRMANNIITRGIRGYDLTYKVHFLSPLRFRGVLDEALCDYVASCISNG